MATTKELINQWIELQENGNVSEAQSLYNNQLFEHVIEQFVERYSSILPGVEVLFSVLGYTPEPMILTQRVLKPKIHVIFSTKGGYKGEVKDMYERFVKAEPKMIEFQDASFSEIYNLMKSTLDILPARKYALDITGGKKSMVASAAIFGRDFGFNITYVDFTEYSKNFRRPIPGSEVLNVVYSPERDLPEAFHGFD